MNNDEAITTILISAIENALPDIAEMVLNSSLGTTDINERKLDIAFYSFYELSENASDEYIERCVKLIKLLKKHGYKEREDMLFYTLERITNPVIFDAFYTCFTNYYTNLEAEAKSGSEQLSPVIIAFHENNIEIAEYLISKGHTFFKNTLGAPHDVLAYAESEAFTFYLSHSNLSSITITERLIEAVAKLTSEKSHTVILNSCIQSILGSPALIQHAYLCCNVSLIEFAHRHSFDIKPTIDPVFTKEFKRLDYVLLAQSETAFSACLHIDPTLPHSELIQSHCLQLALSKNYIAAIEYILNLIEHNNLLSNRYMLTVERMIDALTGINKDTPECILNRLESIVRSFKCSQSELNINFGRALYFMLSRYAKTNHFDLTVVEQCQRFGISLSEPAEGDCVGTSFLNTMFSDRTSPVKRQTGAAECAPMAIIILKTINANGTGNTFNEILNCDIAIPFTLRQIINTLKKKDSSPKRTIAEILIHLCTTQQRGYLLNLITPLRENELSPEFIAMLDTWELTPYDILQSSELNINNKTKAEIAKTLSL